MRRFFVAVIAALMMGVFSPFVMAFDATTGSASMAKYFGADTSVFISLRIDEGYLEELSGIANRVIEKLPADIAAGIPTPIDLEALLAGGFVGAPVDYEALRAALGDYAAVGIGDLERFAETSETSSPEGVAIALQVSDRAALEALLASALPAPESEPRNGQTVYRVDSETYLVVGDEVAYFVPNLVSLPDTSSSLLDAPGYLETGDALPADSYNIYIYVAYGDFFTTLTALGGPEAMSPFTPDMLELLPTYAAVGLTVLDGRVLTIDVATDQAIEGVFTTPVDPSFGALVPNGVDFFVWGADLNGYVTYLLELLPASVAAGMPGSEPAEIEAQIDQAIALIQNATGINLLTDVFAWMDADYALYASLDVDNLVTLAGAAIAGGNFPNLPQLPFEFGFVAATSDAATTAETVVKISTLLRAALANATEVTITDVNDDGLVGIELQITIPVPGPSRTTSLNILLASDDDVFFLGTTQTAEALRAGNNVLSDEVFLGSLAYALPNQVAYAYLSTDGLATLVGLSATAGLTSSSFGQTAQQQADSFAEGAAILLPLLSEIFDHSIISSGYTDSGYTIGRATIALK